MKKKLKIINYVAVVMLILLGCQEYYTNDQLDATDKIPVIEGYFSNSERPSKINLYYASPYNENWASNISGAHIVIIDDLGSEVVFNERSAGFYQTAIGEKVGHIGRTYYLHVTLPDGTIIESVPELMQDTVGIEEISQDEYYSQERIIEDNSGNFSTVTETGLGVLLTVNNTEEEKQYFKLEGDYYVHSEYYQSFADTLDTMLVTTYREYDCYEYYMNRDLPFTDKLQNSLQLDKDSRTHLVQFLPTDYNNAYEYNYGYYNRFVRWIVYAEAHTINKSSYEFLESVSDQLSAEGRIFDPIASQIAGNLFCPQDSSKVVIGQFDVSSVSRRIYAITPTVDGFSGNITFVDSILADTSKFANGCYLRYEQIDTIPLNDSIPF